MNFMRIVALLLLGVLAGKLPAEEPRASTVLVRFKSGVSADEVRSVESRHGLRTSKYIRAFGIRVYNLSSDDRSPMDKSEELRLEPSVDSAEPDYRREFLQIDPDYHLQWYLKNTGQRVNQTIGPPGFDINWEAAKAAHLPAGEVLVAVIDSGVALAHADLIKNVHFKQDEWSDNWYNEIDEDLNGLADDVWGYDFYSSDPLPLDQNGHGTLVAGIIAATIDNGKGVAGITNIAKIRAYRVFDQFGRSGVPKLREGMYVSDILSAVGAAYEDGCRVINMSLGGYSASSIEYSAYRQLSGEGILIVAAAGNGGADGKGDDNDAAPIFPACYPLENILSVAAQDRSGGLAPFSNFGRNSVHIAAPGTDIRGLDVTRKTIFSTDFSTSDGWEFGKTGSSAGSAYVSGGFLRTGSVSASGHSSWAISPLINGSAYSGGLRVEYEGSYNLGANVAYIEMSYDKVTWYPYALYLGSGAGFDQFDASDYDFLDFYLRVNLVHSGSNQSDFRLDSIRVSAVDDLDLDNPQYQYNRGTSFSAPMVSGVAAMILSQYPELSGKDAREVIISSARKVTTLSGKCVSGGMLDAHAALIAAGYRAGYHTPVFTRQPEGGLFLEGGYMRLSPTLRSEEGLVFQWFKDGVALPGQTKARLEINALSSDDAGAYHLVATSRTGSLESGRAVVRVLPRQRNFLPFSPSASRRVFVGQPVEFASGVAEGGAAFYSWFKSGKLIPGKNGPTLSFSAVTFADGGEYTLQARTPSGTIVSSPCTLVVYGFKNAPPPALDLPVGGRATLSATPQRNVAYKGEKITWTYQWYRNGEPISGASGQSLPISGGNLDDEVLYTLRVGDSYYGDHFEISSVVRTVSPINITSMPSAINGFEGESIELSPSISGGGGSTTYQWYLNNKVITGANTPKLVLPVAKGRDSGTYHLVARSTVGTVASSAVSVVVQGFKADLPAALIVLPGKTAKLSVTPTTPPSSYQWRLNGANIAGATSPSLSISAPSASSVAIYDVVLRFGSKAVQSRPCEVRSAESQLGFATNLPQKVYLLPGASQRLAVKPKGFNPSRYSWSKDGALLDGAAGPSLVVSAPAAGEVAIYRVHAHAADRQVSSVQCEVMTVSPAEIVTAPANFSGYLGERLRLTVEARGTAPLTYQWLKNGKSIAGAVGAELILPFVTQDEAGSYVVRVSGPANTVTSTAAVVKVGPTKFSSTTTFGSFADINPGGSAYVGVDWYNYGYDGEMTYSWEKNGLSIYNYTGYIAINNGGYGANGQNAEDFYALAVTNGKGEKLNVHSRVLLREKLEIVGPASSTAAAGTPHFFTVGVVSGAGPFAYQWYKKGVAISGEQTRFLFMNSVSPSDAGSYSVRVTAANGVYQDRSFTLSVGVKPSISLNLPVEPAKLVPGSSHTLRVVASAPFHSSYNYGYATTGQVNYLWHKNGVPLAGATSASYTFTVPVDGNDEYSVWVYNDYGSAWSNSHRVQSLPALASGPVSLVRTIQTKELQTIFNSNSTSTGWTSSRGSSDVVSSGWASTYDGSRGVYQWKLNNFTSNFAQRYLTSPFVSLYGTTSARLRYTVVQAPGPSAVVSLSISADNANWQTLQAVATVGSHTVNIPSYYEGLGFYLRVTYSGTTGSAHVESMVVDGVRYYSDPSHLLQVQTSGSALTYQWYKDGTLLSGEIFPYINVPDVNVPGVSGTYKVVVTNSVGSVDRTAEIRIISKPVITRQPVGATVPATLKSIVRASLWDFAESPDDWQLGRIGTTTGALWHWDQASGRLLDRLGGSSYGSNVDSYAATPAVDLGLLHSPELRFYMDLKLAPDGYDKLTVEISKNNGSTWNVLDTKTGVFAGNVSIPLSGLDYQSFMIRFRMTTNSSATNAGVVIDNVEVQGTLEPPSSSVELSVEVSEPYGCTYMWYRKGIRVATTSEPRYIISGVTSLNDGDYYVIIVNSAGSTQSNTVNIGYDS